MDLFIKTLTGSVFKIRVSPNDTVLNLKRKIQRLEGIPVVQQHLIHQNKELLDSLSLKEYNISSESNLQLVLGMKGGPINTRHVTIPFPTSPLFETLYSSSHSSPRSPPNSGTDCHTNEILDPNKEIFEEFPYSDDSSNASPMPPHAFPITFLIVKSGDQINLFKMIDWGICDVPNCCDAVPKSSEPQTAVDSSSDNENCDELEALTALYLSQLEAYHNDTSGKEAILDKTDSHSMDETFMPDEEFDLKWKYYSELINMPISQEVETQAGETSDYDKLKEKLFQLQSKMKLMKSKACCDSFQGSNEIQKMALIEKSRTDNGDEYLNDNLFNNATCIGHHPPVHQPLHLDELKSNESMLDPTQILLADNPVPYQSIFTKRNSSANKEMISVYEKFSCPKTEIIRPTTSFAKSQTEYSPTTDLQSREMSSLLRPATAESIFRKVDKMNCKRSRVPGSSLIFKSSPAVMNSMKIHNDLLQPNLIPKEGTTTLSVERRDIPATKPSLPNINANNKSKRNYFSSLKATAAKSNEMTLPDILISKKAQSFDTETASTFEFNIPDTKSETKSKIRDCRPILPLLKGGLSPVHPISQDKFVSSNDKRINDSSISLPRIDNSEALLKQSILADKPGASPDNLYHAISTKRFGNTNSPRRDETKKPSVKRKPRCKQCHKKISILNSYPCRCGNLYCAKHRYSELHQCSYDYKEKGRKYIQDSNPVVQAPKLPKI